MNHVDTHGIPSSDEGLTEELTRAFLGYQGPQCHALDE